jgi:hypothetical protein
MADHVTERQDAGDGDPEGFRIADHLHADLHLFHAEMFRPYVGTMFTIEGGNGALELELSEVDEQPRYTRPGAPRTAFTLLFRGPWSQLLPDGFYRVTHPEAGDFGALTLMPCMPPEGLLSEQALYQVVFN